MLPIGEEEKTAGPCHGPSCARWRSPPRRPASTRCGAADHLVFLDDGAWSGIHECWTILTAVAAITERVEIGPLVLALPFRNPALTGQDGRPRWTRSRPAG